MAVILHLVTRENDALAAEMVRRQKESGHEVTVIDLTAGEPDYREIVKTIFQADTVQTW